MRCATVHGDETGAYATLAAGFLIDMDGKGFHHAGDTALTRDMELLRGQVDVALLPIGDNFTMGPADAARAVDFISPKIVVPIHYDTWDIVAQDPELFRSKVGDKARVQILDPGESFEF